VHLATRGTSVLGEQGAVACEAAYHAALHSALLARRGLGDVASCLDRAGVDWLTFKGPVLSEVAYPRSDLRSYSDLDVLVRPSAFADAVKTLEADGHEVLDRNWRAIRDALPAQVHVRLASGASLDLHWNLVNHAHLRRTFTVATNDLFERSRWVTCAGTETRTLSPEDTFVHVALHACLSGANRLIWCADVDQLFRRGNARWSDVVQRAREWRAGLAVASMAVLAARTLGTPVGPHVLNALAPRGWRSFVALLDHFTPVAAARESPSVASISCRAVREDVPSTCATAARRAGVWLRGHGPLVPAAGTNTADDPSSVLYASGGPDDRDAYLAVVARM
jgi:hypothetical protein